MKFLKDLAVKFYNGLKQCNSLLFVAFGIPLIMHWSTWCLCLLLLLFYPPMALIYALVLISIVPHEFGHALAARRYGIPCKKIILFPIGGLALLKEIPREPRKELFITAAGPVVTLALFIITGFLLFVLGVTSESIYYLCGINMVLFIFNMLPCFPMDGGRIFRSLLAMCFSYFTATKVAVRTSQCLCLAMIVYGILTTSLMLLVTAMFILMFAGAELDAIQKGNEEPKEIT